MFALADDEDGFLERTLRGQEDILLEEQLLEEHNLTDLFPYGLPAGFIWDDIMTDDAALITLRRKLRAAFMTPKEKREEAKKNREFKKQCKANENWGVLNNWTTCKAGSKKRYEVIIYEHALTKERRHEIEELLSSDNERMMLTCRSLKKAFIWQNADAEKIAREKLLSLLRPAQVRALELTDAFCEPKTRSGLHYIIRRNRPTLAFRAQEDGSFHFVSGLCSHPTGYYANTYTGFLCPSDEMIAHLLMIRYDEIGFWKTANPKRVSDVTVGF
ncbi:hypothetical protein IPM19_03135 [bacterium]|nr:MAG: hypothetical protein IPM19_03135 [bacterium]